jgi:hypothetical protein
MGALARDDDRRLSESRHRNAEDVHRHVERVRHLNTMRPQIASQTPGAGDRLPSEERSHRQFEDRDARLAQFFGAKSAGVEAGHVRLKARPVERERRLRKLSLCAADA